MHSASTYDSSGAKVRPSGSNTALSEIRAWILKWLVLIVCCIFYAAFVGMELIYPRVDHRAQDAALYLFAAALGIAFGHSLIKQSMEKSKAKLSVVVDRYMDELDKENDTRKSASNVEPLLLPIPYIVSRLRDGGTEGFGYFGGKLVNRDPRLLLDLALDEALAPGDNRKIWEVTEEIKKTSKEAETPSGGASQTAQNVAKTVAEAVITKLRGDVETAVSEALKTAQEQSDKQKPGGSRG